MPATISPILSIATVDAPASMTHAVQTTMEFSSPNDGVMLSAEPIDPIGMVAVAGGLTIAVIISVTAILAGVANARQRERTRREVAAYLAEGSITSEDAERILSAKMTDGCN